MQHLLDKNVNYLLEISFHTYIPRVDPGFSERFSFIFLCFVFVNDQMSGGIEVSTDK